MQSKTQKRYLAYLLLLAVFALTAASASSQERKALPNNEGPITNAACPKTIALTLTANPANVVPGDFSPAQLAAQVGFNYPGPNKHVLGIFAWKTEYRCCQITRAVLTVKVKAIQGGQNSTSPDAGNDGIAIMYQGLSVQSQPLYSPSQYPVIAGQVYTTQVILNAAALNNLSIFGQTSFAVQDDSSVQSATLQLWGCCLALAK